MHQLFERTRPANRPKCQQCGTPYHCGSTQRAIAYYYPACRCLAPNRKLVRQAKTALIAIVLLLGLLPSVLAEQATDARQAAYAVDVGDAGGSGIGIHDCLVATNAHVVGRTGAWAVCRSPYQSVRGEVVACDPKADVALIYVASADVRWLPIATSEPELGEQAWFLGFGTWRYLVPRSAQIASKGRFRTSDGVPMWELSKPAHSGDSGCGVIDRELRIVGLVWGTDGGQAAMLPAAYISRTAKSWAENCMGERSVQFCQCWGGSCSRGTRVVIERPQPQARPQTVPVPQPKVEIEYKRILDMMAADERFRGRAGAQGPAGRDGPPGKDGTAGPAGPIASIDYTLLVDLMAKDGRFTGPRGPSGKDGSPGKDATIDPAAIARQLPPIYLRKRNAVTGEETQEAIRLGEGFTFIMHPGR